MLTLGIDVGTQGARAMVVNLRGYVLAEASQAFSAAQITSPVPGMFEQNPSLWEEALEGVIRTVLADLGERGLSADMISALSVTSTSGTLCLIDAQGQAVRPAIMYSDTRSSVVADVVQVAGSAWAEKHGTGFSASFALTKLYWLAQQAPAELDQARWFTSPTDVVIGWLTGIWDRTDWTNALKWGYDVVDLAWPAFIEKALGLPLAKFPRVESPGTVVGAVSREAARRTGLSPRTLVVAGSTDGTASQLASGAVEPGAWNSTLGTTLVLKGVSHALLRDPQGRLYCHRHPDGPWLPGGASSTGADCLTVRFNREDLGRLNAGALSRCPTNMLVYPLIRQGERLPFMNPEARGFVAGEPKDELDYYAAHLEGIAYIERMCYDVVRQLGGVVGDEIHCAGGGSHSDAGLQVRADVLGKSLRVPMVPEGAMGAAILAARGCAYDSVSEAARNMVRYDHTVEPRASMVSRYEANLQRFVLACQQLGYVP
jgi:D-ribulokinase